MKLLFKSLIVLSVIGMFLFSCQKYTETNPANAQDQKSSQGTAWLQANASSTQSATTSGVKINIDVKDGGAQIDLVGGEAVVNRSGDYLIVAAPQVGYDGTGVADFRCWLAVNDTYVDNSNVLLQLKSWTKDVIISQGIVSLNKGDVVSVYMASNGGAYAEAILPPEGVAVPAMIFTIYAIN